MMARRAHLWGWIPVFVVAAAIAILRMLDIREDYSRPFLMLALNAVFFGAVLLTVAFLIVTGYFNQGSPGLLLLGCGVVALMLSGLVAPVLMLLNVQVEGFPTNVWVTLHNSCTWVAALFHLMAVTVPQNWSQPLRARGLWAAVAFSCLCGLFVLIGVAMYFNWFPPFYIEGYGGTPLRQYVLGSAICMFSFGALFLHGFAGREPHCFPYWYGLALLLVAIGFFGGETQCHWGTAVSWAARLSIYLGLVYMLIAAIHLVRRTGRYDLDLGRMLAVARQRQGVAIAIVIAAGAARWMLFPAALPRITYLPFYPAVMFAVHYGGMRSGLLASAFSVVLANHFWIDRSGSFSAGDSGEWLRATTFLASCVMICWISREMQRAKERAIAAEEKSKHAEERRMAREKLFRSQIERERLQRELLEISEREKQTIAQELHDGLCQHLAGTAMMTKLLQQRLASGKSPEAEFAREICGLLTTAVNEARNLSHGLHPVEGGPSGLMDALETMVRTVTNLFHIRCHFRCSGVVLLDNKAAATHLFRIAQESINNAIKHGEATRIVIGLRRVQGQIILDIRDDGIGISQDVPMTGMGLKIMRHRASLIGASVTISPSRKCGTLVRCILPVNQPLQGSPEAGPC